jgi:glycosyltransferase involved in cell wall biosynthesis
MKNNVQRLLSIIKNKNSINFLKNKLYKNKCYENDEQNIIDFILESEKPYKDIKISYKKIKSITFLIPDFGIGSGGHTTIFRIASYMEKSGYNINLVLTGPTKFKDKNYLKYFINEYFIKFNPTIFLTVNDYLKTKIPISEILICTSWKTAYYLNRFPSFFLNKFYLVQDYEAHFNPLSSLYYFAENTYKLPFFNICASKWLSQIISENFNTKTDYFNLGFDKNYYFPLNNKRDKKSIIYYGRWETPRRGFEIAMSAFKILKEQDNNIKIKIYGSNNLNGKVPFEFTNLGQLSYVQLAKEFNEATVGLSISLTNISLTPCEMMACKLPVLEINHPSVNTMFKHKKDLLLSEPNPFDVAKKLKYLLDNKNYRVTLANNGYKKVTTNYTWINAFEKFKKIIEKNSK